MSAAYTVNHQKYDYQGTTKQGDAEVEIIEGQPGTYTKAQAKTYTGYTAQSFSQETIKDDGSTVIYIKYYEYSPVAIKYIVKQNG